MSENEIKQKAAHQLEQMTKEELINSCFFNTFAAKIALVRAKYFEYLRQNVASLQAITNCSIEFEISEGSVQKYVYEYKSISFKKT